MDSVFHLVRLGYCLRDMRNIRWGVIPSIREIMFQSPLRKINLHSAEIGHILAGLVEKGMLVTDNKGRWTNYRLNKDYVIQPEQLSLTDSITVNVEFTTDSDQLIYEYAKENGFITTPQVIAISPNITTRQGASVALNRLIKKGHLHMVGKGKKTIYEFIE